MEMFVPWRSRLLCNIGPVIRANAIYASYAGTLVLLILCITIIAVGLASVTDGGATLNVIVVEPLTV